MRFYKKLHPATKVAFGNALIPFKSNDGLVGFFWTEDAAVVTAFEDHMRNSRFGISEISYEQFQTEYVQKKTGATSKPTWREEFSGAKSLAQSMSGDLSSQSSVVAVAVAEDTVAGKPDEPGAAPVVVAPKPSPAPMPEASTVTLPTKETVHAPEKPDFQPTVGKRKRGRRSFPD